MQTISLQRGERARQIERVSAFLSALPANKAYRIDIAEEQPRRSIQQNRALWGYVYPAILKAGGETLAGWTADDLHEYLLGEWAGWQTLEGFGRKRVKPIRRSSALKVTEFMDYIAFIQQRMAEHGIYVDDPGFK